MKILLFYATYSGGTQMASQLIANLLSKYGHTIEIKEAQDITFDILNSYDLVIMGSPTWSGGSIHDFFAKFIKNSEGKILQGKLFAIFGLGDSSYSAFCKAVDYLEEFVKNIQGKLVIESLRIDGFFFTQSKSEEKITQWVEDLHKNSG